MTRRHSTAERERKATAEKRRWRGGASVHCHRSGRHPACRRAGAYRPVDSACGRRGRGESSESHENRRFVAGRRDARPTSGETPDVADRWQCTDERRWAVKGTVPRFCSDHRSWLRTAIALEMKTLISSLQAFLKGRICSLGVSGRLSKSCHTFLTPSSMAAWPPVKP